LSHLSLRRQPRSTLFPYTTLFRSHGVSSKRCGAKTRTGAPCKALAMPNGRCRMHGGGSLALLAHPNYKHGRYSKYSPEGIAFRAAQKRRKHLRERIRAIRKMTARELRAEAVRIFGRLPGADWDVREFRAMLIESVKVTHERRRPVFFANTNELNASDR